MQIVPETIDRSTLTPGYYWVLVGEDPEIEGNEALVRERPAQFIGYDVSGREDWSYLHVYGEPIWAPTEVIARLDPIP